MATNGLSDSGVCVWSDCRWTRCGTRCGNRDNQRAEWQQSVVYGQPETTGHSHAATFRPQEKPN